MKPLNQLSRDEELYQQALTEEIRLSLVRINGIYYNKSHFDCFLSYFIQN